MKWGACFIIFALAFASIGAISASSCERTQAAEGPACYMMLWETPSISLNSDASVPPTATKIVAVVLAVVASTVLLVRPASHIGANILQILHFAFDFALRPRRSEAATLRPS